MSTLLSPGHYFGNEQLATENDLFKINITQYEACSEIKTHAHQNAYLSLLIRGNYCETSGRSDTQVNTGEVLFRPAGYDHSNQFLSAGGRCLNIELKKNLLEEYDLAGHLPDSVRLYTAGSFVYLYKLLYQFNQQEGVEMSVEYILHWLVQDSEISVVRRLPWLAKVTTILESEFDVHHTIQSLASRVFVHPVYLARAFHERTGLTVGEYQQKMKLKKATELLFRSGDSIGHLAFDSGFTDAAHLIRTFRQSYNITPSRFRRSIRS